MEKPGTGLRQCLREDGTPKLTFLTKKEAKQHIKNLPGSAETGWKRMYSCADCGYYHTGRLG